MRRLDMTDWKHDYARLSVVTLHYVTAGTGDPVVLLHGWPQPAAPHPRKEPAGSPPSRPGEAVEGGEDQALGAVLAEAGELVLLEHAEGLGRVVRPLGLGRVEDVDQLPRESPYLMAKKASSSARSCARRSSAHGRIAWLVLGQLQHAWRDEIQIGLAESSREQNWKLLEDEIVDRRAPIFWRAA